MSEEATAHRFLTVEEAAEELNVSSSQIRALLRVGELRGIQIGGRGLWRIGRVDVESYIESAYRKTAARIPDGELCDEGLWLADVSSTSPLTAMGWSFGCSAGPLATGPSGTTEVSPRLQRS